MQSRTSQQQESGADPQPFFPKFARVSARLSGHPFAFSFAFIIIVVWAVSGPIFKFSDTWQLMINTATTIVTFLMVFLVQNAQSQESEAIQLKLTELIRATEAAHKTYLEADETYDPELERIKKHFGHLAETARQEFLKKNSVGPQTQVRKSNRAVEPAPYHFVSHHKPILTLANQK